METGYKKISTSIMLCPRFIEVFFAFVLFAIIALPFYKQIPNSLIFDQDEYKHLLIAQSLTTKESLHPQALEGIEYPVGWGAVICFLLVVFGNELQTIHALTTALAWLTGPLVYIYLRKQTETLLALAIGGFTSAHFLTITVGDTLLSEPIFGVAWLLCLLWLHLSMNSRWSHWILTGSFVTMCMNLRTIGISLWVGAFFYLAINSKNNLRIKLIHIVCLSVIPISYLLLLNIFHPAIGIRADAGYGIHFFRTGLTSSNEMVVGIIKRTVKDMPLHTRDLIQAMIPTNVSGPRVRRFGLFTASGLLILALLGWVRRIRRTPTPMEYTFACYLGICYLWPYTGYPRFYWPVVPLIVFYAITNLTEMKFYKKRAVFSTIVLGSIIIMAAMVSLSKNLSVPLTYRLERAEHEMAIKEAVIEATRLSATPIIATMSYFKVMYYFPDIRICRLRHTTNQESHQRRINKCGATFLLLAKILPDYYNSLLIHANSEYQLVFRKAGVYLWHIQS